MNKASRERRKRRSREHKWTEKIFMSKHNLLVCVLGFVWAFSMTNTAMSETILFDLGLNTLLSDVSIAPLYAHWNNVTSHLAGVQITKAVDTTGRATTVSYNAIMRWSYTNNAGVDADGIYGRLAQKDSFFLDSSYPTASIDIEGLPSGESYSFTFFGSRAATAPRRIDITIGGITKTLETAYNVNNTITFSGVFPDASDKVRIDCTRNAGSTYAYLGVIEINGNFPSSPVFDANTSEFYVAPNGSNLNPGTKAAPFRTIEWARNTVRQLKQSIGLPSGGVTVYLCGGRYFRTNTLEITSEDSGTADKPILYRACPGEEVHIIGGLELDPNWFSLVTSSSPVWNRLDAAAKGNVMQVSLAAHGITDYGQLKESTGVGGENSPLELNFNGDMMQLARWPNSGFETVVSAPNDVYGKQFTYSGTRPERWILANDPWVFGYWYWDWYDEYLKMTNINTATKTISVTPGPAYGIRGGQRWYALNLLEEIDIPGEWYLDRSNGILYFWPPADLNTGVTLISTLKSAIVKVNQASYVVLRDIIFEMGRSGGIDISGGNNNLISKCKIRSLSSYGVSITGIDSGIEDCEIYDLGYAIGLSGGDRSTLTPANLFANNNHIHDFARWKRTYVPGISISGCGNRISHNLIYNGPHSAITHYGNDHIMEYNIIHDVVLESSDSGAIYSGRDWSYQGNIIRYNFIHHIVNTLSSDIHAVYLDDMLSGHTVFGNVFYEIAGIAMFNNGGRDNITENNVFAKCKWANYGCRRGVDWINCTPGTVWYDNFLGTLKYFNYQNPPWSTAYPQAAAIPNDCTLPEFEDYKNPGGCKIIRNIGWQNTAFKYDAGSGAFSYYTIADNIENQDPLFVDEANLNLALRDNSPAYSIPGFQRIPFEKIGLLKDSDLDEDGNVDFSDLAMLLVYWVADECSPQNNWCQRADLDLSGTVNMVDCALFAKDWGDQNITANPVSDQDPNYVFVENWNYTLNQPLSEVSSWKVGYWTEKCHVITGPDVGNYVEVDQTIYPAGDAIYIRDQALDGDTGVNYLFGIAGKPLIQAQVEMYTQGAADHLYVGLGQFTSWTGAKQAFNFAMWQGQWWVYNAAGVLYKDMSGYTFGKWYDVKAVIDPAANGGDGELDFYYKLQTDIVWTASLPLSNLNLQLKSAPAIDDPYTEWTGMFIRPMGGAKLGNMEITGVERN